MDESRSRKMKDQACEQGDPEFSVMIHRMLEGGCWPPSAETEAVAASPPGCFVSPSF